MHYINYVQLFFNLLKLKKMKLKNFLLGASIAICGAAFGQSDRVYVPDYDVMLYVASFTETEDDDGNPAYEMEVISSEAGEVPTLEEEPAGKWYLGTAGGYTGAGGPVISLIICGNRSSQCFWTSWN
jgi:hypothetical protein